MGYDVKIEMIGITHPCSDGGEFISFINNSGMHYDLAGWKMIYTDLVSGNELHTYYFPTIPTGGSFAPGERIFLINHYRRNEFFYAHDTPHYPIPHFRIFTGISKNIINNRHCKVTLVDSKRYNRLSVH